MDLSTYICNIRIIIKFCLKLFYFLNLFPVKLQRKIVISVYIKEKQKMSKGDSNSKVENEKQPKLAKDKHQSLKKEK